MRYPTVLFDLDGTLVDSGAIILSSFKHAARTVLARDVEEEQIAALVGGSNLHDQMRVLSPAHVDELVRVYREHNRPLHDELEAFEGVEELVETLSEQGRKLGIVTAKGRQTVDLAFAVLSLERYFDAVVTADMTDRHKPDPAPVLKALELLESEPADSAFVGDSPYDITAGKAAGVFTVAVSWGKIHPEERLLEAGADFLAHSPRELLDVL
ncbi:MAG TPA: HAD-IA family hydrolase [Gaiellaceae bacterium]|jgi:pyrophosphatase PpaX|nr:HAD-IA family hydrolase [Gaiellaceae bacterium]